MRKMVAPHTASSLKLAALVALAAGCGGAAALVGPAQPQEPPPVAPAPAPVTCGDAGVLLRGSVEDQQQAGPAKEAAIARTCRLERWSPEILRCVGGKAAATPCLARLSAAQRTAYDQALSAWNEEYPDEYVEEPDFDDLADDYVECSDAIKDAGSYAPAVTLAGADRAFVVDMRGRALLALCEDWSAEQRACFRDAAPAGIAACRARLEPAQERAVADKLAELDRIGGKLAAQQRAPAGFDCKRVVAVHYADAAWKGEMDAVKGADRARAIAESRARMTKACADDKWPPSMRACIAGGGGEPCFTGVPYSSWRFPAVGVIVKTGIAECDAYGAVVKASAACQSLPASTRDAVQKAWEHLGAAAAGAPPDRRQTMADACRQIDSAIRQSLAAAGCKI